MPSSKFHWHKLVLEDREKLGTSRMETRGGRQSGTRGGIKWGCPGVS